MAFERHHNLLWTSSYDRGLDLLLFIWSDIKKEVPDANLFIAYGWKLFDIMASSNPERQEWKRGVEMLMRQEGIYHLGRIGKEELKKIRQKCGILAYPSYFQEINCLSIIEAAKEGVVPVSTTIGAIPETLKHGIFIDGDIKDKKVLEKYKQELISLMKDKKRWERLSRKCQKEARKYEIDRVAYKWIEVFEEPLDYPMVSIITPTIREGFWGSMARNLLGQTYPNFEWIIIDDYPEDRSKIAQEYKNNRFEIKYFRGGKAGGDYKRKIGIARANNIGWKNAKGELLIWLQDFVYLPKDGIERIVDLYRHNKNSLLAPVDIYYKPIIEPNLQNKKDWFDNEKYLNVVGDKNWENVRVKYQGIRESTNPFDFELNCGAIPKSIVESLGGFYEFFDDGLGYDNTDIAYRALKAGYKLIIDDSIIVSALNIWDYVRGKPTNVVDREKLINTPRYLWMVKKIEEGKLPVIRDEKIDDKISLKYDIPEGVNPDVWVEKNTDNIIKSWEKEVRQYERKMDSACCPSSR